MTLSLLSRRLYFCTIFVYVLYTFFVYKIFHTLYKIFHGMYIFSTECPFWTNMYK